MSTSTTVFGSLPDPQAEVRTPLRGHWLALARLAWVATLILVSIIFINGLPFRYVQTYQETGAFLQTHPDTHMKITAVHIASYVTLLDCIIMGCFLGVAVLLFWHRSSDWFGIFTSLMLLLFGATGN